MEPTITRILHDFLRTRRILAEVARRIDKSLSTLASELNPRTTNAKFGMDDFGPLCKAVREIGYGREMDGILHEYFENLKGRELTEEDSEDLASLASGLMARTAVLADGTTKLMYSADPSQLREIQQMIRSELVPTAIHLCAMIDRQLERGSEGDEPAFQSK